MDRRPSGVFASAHPMQGVGHEHADLLVLDTGALVPVVFVADGPTDGVVLVDVPDGLFELTDPGGGDDRDADRDRSGDR